MDANLQVLTQETRTVRLLADLEEDLAAVERHLDATERKYLESTGHGNVLKGWKELVTTNKINNRRKDRFDPRDRIFTASSTSGSISKRDSDSDDDDDDSDSDSD